METSIVIVTFNSAKYIKNCIDSLIADLEDGKVYEILIVDNASDDKTVDLVQTIKSNFIKIISNPRNEGYSKSVNRGVLEAKFLNILILNPDTIIKKGAISNLSKTLLSRKNIGVVGPRIVNNDGSFQLSSRRHFPTCSILLIHALKLNKIFPKSRVFGKYNYTFVDNRKFLNVDSISGSCMMFNRESFQDIGGFDEAFFMYFEDTDFCTRLVNKGYEVVYCPLSEVVHNNDYRDHYQSKMDYFYESFYIFICKHRHKIYLFSLISLLVSGIRHFSYLKRIIYFNYNYKINNE